MNVSPPSSSKKGTRRSFPAHRETILDILRYGQATPSFPVLRRMQLSDLVVARRNSEYRIGWTTLFGKAYAMVCQQMPELRELFVSYPRKHLYCHPHSVASISIHRPDDSGRERLIWGRWCNAESTSLIELQNQLDMFCKAPLAQAYREGLIMENRNALLRRFVWWWVMRCSGRKRAKHVGTFSISSLGGQGALNLHHPLITTTSLAFGQINSDHECDVSLICDHRVIDGVLAATALQRLERILNQEMATELKGSLAQRVAA